MKPKLVYVIKAKYYWTCPICYWRCNPKSGFRHHLKYQHRLGKNQVKLVL